MKQIYIILFALLLTLNSCISDILSQSNPNESEVEYYWDDLTDTETALNSVYNALYNDYLLAIEQFTLCSDMGYPGADRDGAPTDETLSSYYYHTYTKSSTAVQSKWSALYTGVYRANQVISGLEELLTKGYTSDDSTWIEQMAQARFFRGLFHFYLHSVFNNGEIVLFKAMPESYEDYYQSISSYDEVLEFFREDLLYAYENLPTQYDDSEDFFRATRGAAATNLATTYLYEEEFDESLVYLTDIITNLEYGYELESDMDKMFTSDGEFNSESILEINYELGVKSELTAWDESAPTNRLGYTSKAYSSFTLPCWITHLYQTEKMNEDDDRNMITYTDDSGVVRSDSLRTLSLRGTAMIATVQDDNSEYYLEPITSVAVSVSQTLAIGYYRKYTNWDICADEADLPDGARKSGKNITINRLSEVYLMYAECMLRKSSPNVTEALKYMNLIRDRWALQLLGTPGQNPDQPSSKSYDGVVYTVETLLTQLQDVDRPLELSVEGHALRYIDLRRWGSDYAQRRYTTLGEEIYNMCHRYVPNATTPRWSTWCVLDGYPIEDDYAYAGFANLTLNDFKTAAQNYRSADHSYWPIPQVEELNNPNLYNN